MSTLTAPLKESYYYLTPILQVRQLRRREVKTLSQGNRASDMQSWDLKAGIFETSDQSTFLVELL